MQKWLDDIKARFGAWWPQIEPAAEIAFVLAALMVSGCATGGNPFAGTTTATWEKTADGLQLKYASSKEQNNLHATGNVNTGNFEVTVDKAGAQDSAVAAFLQAQTLFLQTLQQILNQALNTGKAAAVSGS